MRVEHGERQRGRAEARQHLHQGARGQLAGDVVGRHLDDPEARLAGRHVGVAIVHRHRVGQAARLDPAIDGELEGDRLAGGGRLVIHRPVPGQIVRHLGHAVAGQVGTAYAAHLGQHREAARHQRRIAQLTDPQHAIDALADQVDLAVGDAHLHLDLRITGAELRQRRDHHQPPEGHRQVHLDAPPRLPGRLREGRLHLVHVGQDRHAALVVAVAVEGGAHLAGGALEQAHPQVGLELLDDLRRRRPRQAQVLGSAAEAAQLDDAGEQAHGLETIHGGPSIVWLGQTVLANPAHLSIRATPG